MARKNRTSRRGGGIGRFVWNPFHHLLAATGESAEKLGRGTGKLAKGVTNTVKGVGNTVAKHTNQTLSNALGGLTKRRKSRRSKTRRN